jgi:hypothetical protein
VYLVPKQLSALTFRCQGILSNEKETTMLKPDFTYFKPIPSARNQRISKKSEDGIKRVMA